MKSGGYIFWGEAAIAAGFCSLPNPSTNLVGTKERSGIMLKNKKFISTKTVAFLLASSLGLSSISATSTLSLVKSAQASSRSTYAPKRVLNSNGTYTVRSGDTLWFIAKDFGTSPDHIKSLNGLKSDKLTPGQILRIASSSDSINLTIGSKGRQVADIQRYLIKLGFYSGIVDGIYGLDTARGVVRFQRSKGIYANGKVDSNTYNALVSAYNKKASSTSATSASGAILTIGSKGSQVANVQRYLTKLRLFSGKIDGIYGLETARGVVRFQRSKGIYANGKVDSKTYSLLQSEATRVSSSSPNRGRIITGGAVAYDWYGSVDKTIFPIGSVAKVTDVITRKSFYVKRTYGSNHADCEALTLNDTNIIKSIWGGFSWDRRPVVVEVNGYRVAASMAAMPHAGLDAYPANAIVSGRSGGYGTGYNFDAVKGNGMDGHFDIHFLNSRRHKDNAIDSEHQAALRQAIGK
jgi:peptidoglycan hydrolase-like protein with peptidoglycan-binding domain